jgi:hypothetical protein
MIEGTLFYQSFEGFYNYKKSKRKRAIHKTKARAIDCGYVKNNSWKFFFQIELTF